MIRIVSFASIALLGLAGVASSAHADDFAFGFGVEGRGRHARSDAWLEVGVGTRPAPRGFATPYPVAAAPSYDAGRVYVAPHTETRSETVCDPAVIEDRVVPVFREVTVPVYGEVRVPIFEERRVPRFEFVLDRHGHRVRIQVGERSERVQVGERSERVQTGTRVERVQVGERTERVVVRPEVCRVVTRTVWVPGRYVTVAPRAFAPEFGGRDRRFDDRGARFDDRGARFEGSGGRFDADARPTRPVDLPYGGLTDEELERARVAPSPRPRR